MPRRSFRRRSATGRCFPTWRAKTRSTPRPKSRRRWIGRLRSIRRNDIAWHILGRWNRVLADVNVVKRVLAKALYGDLPVTTNEEAEKCLRKAIEINPNRLHPLHRAGPNLRADGTQRGGSANTFSKGLAMPDKEKDDPEMKEIGARHALQEIGSAARADFDAVRSLARRS